MSEPAKDPYVAYWAECLSQSFDEHGVSVTPEQLAAIAQDVQSAHEMHGQAFYQPESPLIDEVRHLKEKHARELAEANRIADTWKAEGCRVAGVEPRRAYINNGEVYVSPR